MIITIVTGPWLPVPTLQGGAHHRLWQGLAEEFAVQGHEVTIICRTYPGQPSRETINGVHYLRRGGFPQSTNIWLDLMKDFIYAVQVFPFLPPADITVINDFWLPALAPLRSQSGKVVVSVGRFPKGQYWLYGRAACFIVLSKVIWDAIAKQSPEAIPRMRLIPNPVNTDIFLPRTDRKLERAEKVILYVGRIHPEKGIHLLIEAFSLLSQSFSPIRLKIVGPVEESQGGGGNNYLHELKLKAQGLDIDFLPPIFELSKLAAVYQSADLFCYPSLAEKGEAFPIAPLEAMASGLVPVVSDLACFRDFIEEGETGYFFNYRTSDAPQNLSNQFRSALCNWDTTCKMRIKATQKAQEFNYKTIAKQYLSEFGKLMKKSQL